MVLISWVVSWSCLVAVVVVSVIVVGVAIVAAVTCHSCDVSVALDVFVAGFGDVFVICSILL